MMLADTAFALSILGATVDHASTQVEKLNATLTGHADKLTRELTAFRTFDEMLTAPGHYRPTLMCHPDDFNGRDGCRYMYLADLYDAAQIDRGDPRRAYRGCLWSRHRAQFEIAGR